MTLLGMGLDLKSERIVLLPISLCLLFAFSKHSKLHLPSMLFLLGGGSRSLLQLRHLQLQQVGLLFRHGLAL